jgi:hypothetical protein
VYCNEFFFTKLINVRLASGSSKYKNQHVLFDLGLLFSYWTHIEPHCNNVELNHGVTT